MTWTYEEALRFLYGLTDYEKSGLAAYAPEFYSLDRVQRFLALLGDPQLKEDVQMFVSNLRRNGILRYKDSRPADPSDGGSSRGSTVRRKGFFNR